MKNTFRRIFALHRSPHFYIALGLSIYVPLRLLYILQPFLVYKRCPFIIDDPEIKMLSSVDNFDTYIINRNSDIDVVYLHGSRISARNHIKIAKQINHNVILPFYPGFCTSTGPMNEIEIKKCMLILADTLKKRGKKVKIFAQSLGTAVAYYLSTQIDYDKMVLENSFRDLKTVIKRRWYGIIYIIAYDRWCNHGIEDKKKITYLCSEFDNFVGKDYSFFGDNEKVILKDSSHFNAYRKVKNYAEVINNALNNN